MTNRKQAHQMLELLLDKGVSHETILNWIVNNYLSGEQAINALQLLEMEMFDEVYEEVNDTFYDHEDDVELDSGDDDDGTHLLSRRKDWYEDDFDGLGKSQALKIRDLIFITVMKAQNTTGNTRWDLQIQQVRTTQRVVPSKKLYKRKQRNGKTDD